MICCWNMETCRKSSLIQISPLPQPKPLREITLPQDLVKHQWAPDLCFNENNRHIYLLGATLIIFPTEINRQQIFFPSPVPSSALCRVCSERLVFCECENEMFSNFMWKLEWSQSAFSFILLINNVCFQSIKSTFYSSTFRNNCSFSR